MVDYFGLKSNQDFQKLSIILSNIHIKKSYFEELSEAQNLIKQGIMIPLTSMETYILLAHHHNKNEHHNNKT